MNRLNNFVEPEKLQEVQGDVEESKEVRQVQLKGRVTGIIEGVPVNELPYGEGVEKDAENKVKNSEKIHVGLEHRVVSTFQS